MLSGVQRVINLISYVLMGFVSVSLVVSSIMIGIITYISVLERIKEIGVLRAPVLPNGIFEEYSTRKPLSSV